MILLIDNYDSFAYNLYQYISELGAKVSVVRNDKITLDEIHEKGPEAIVISPGPKTPSEAGISEDVIREFHKSLPIPMHGKTSQIIHNGRSIFNSMEIPFAATRYHSLIVSRENLPERLEVIAWTEDDLLMGLKHKDYPTVGVQFHPESVMTENGKMLLQNFLDGKI